MTIRQSLLFFSKKINGSWIILEKDKQYVRELNEIGSLVWEYARKPATPEKIATKISRSYNQPYEKVLADVTAFVNDYLREGFFVEA